MPDVPDSSSDRDPLDRLAEEFVARYRAGERPAVEEFARRHPELAADVRDLFPALVEMEQLKPVTGDYTRSGPNAPPAFPADRPPDPVQVGEFRILRRVGVGGMGVVYEAVQESLGRHVALKLLPPDALLDARRLERFRREARAAAGLHHTNIVPVFGTGEADGRHFYAMQFISGHPLDAVVDEVRRLKGKSPEAPRGPSRAASGVAAALVTGTFSGPPPLDSAAADLAPTRADGFVPPSVTEPIPVPPHPPSGLSGTASEGGGGYWATCARLAAQVADALAYAHGQGVLHRDIKPANLLVDLRGTVWVTDFGLAKATDADDLTQAGDIVGTLRYMAPERFDGAGDARADVYALGLTLYELLTLKPAFDASSKAKLVEQALAANPPKPRQHNPAIPRDLETVVLKCIARDPALRYQTAAELAADLRRYVEDRPILARRASNAERALRWCRRNPAVAGLLGVALLLLTVIAVGGVVLSVELNAALGQAKSDRDAAVGIGGELRAERDKLLQAEKDRDDARKGNAAAWQSLVARVEADVRSGRPGQRVKPLAEVRQAVQIDRAPRLRDLAAAALVLPDVELVAEWDGWRDDTQGVAFTADLRRFARMDTAGNVELCRRTERGEEVVRRLPAALGPAVSPLYLSPDGRFLAYSRGSPQTYAGRKLCVRDLESEDGLFLLSDEPAQLLYGLAFSPTGKELAVSAPGGALRRYALPDGRLLAREQLKVEAGYIAYDRAGERLAAASGSLTPVFDLRPGRESSHTLRLPHGGGWLTWRPDGALAYGSEHGRIHVIDPDTGADRMPPWQQLGRGYHCPQFTPAGDRAFGSNYGFADVCLWDAHTGRRLLELQETLVTFDRPPTDEAAFVTRSGNKLRLWRLHSGDELRFLPAREGGKIVSGGTDPNGRLLATQSRPGTFGLFDLTTGAAVASGALRADDLRLVPASGRGWRLSGSGGPFEWPVKWNGDQAAVGPLRPAPGPLPEEEPCVSADGKLAAFAAEPGHVRLVDARTGRFVAEVVGPRIEHFTPLHFTPDGGRLVARNAGGTALYVWDLRKIRAQLKALDLDWEWPELPAAPPATGVRVEVDSADLPPPAPPAAPSPAQPKPQPTVYDVARLHLALDPWAADSRLTLAFETFYAGRYEEARGHFTLAALGSRAPGEALAWRGHAWLEQDRWQEAINDYNEALRFSPHFWGTQTDRARANQKLGRHAEAITDLSAVLKSPDRRKDAWLWHLRAASLTALGRTAEAELDAAVAKSLVTADVAKDLNGRAWRSVVRPFSPRAHDAAEDWARLAVGAEPRNPMYINTLGVCLYRTGKYSEAAAVLYAGWALDRGASAAFDLYPLAMCHGKLGDEKRAKEFFSRAVAWHEARAATLSPARAAELAAFRAEAEAVLGLLAPPPRPVAPR